MLHRLKVRAESFDNWAYKVKTALEASQHQKLGEANLLFGDIFTTFKGMLKKKILFIYSPLTFNQVYVLTYVVSLLCELVAYMFNLVSPCLTWGLHV